MTQHEAQLNGFLVNVFNDILRLEEASIRKGPCKNLSVSEMHVLEAVEKSSVDASGAAGMAEVAAHLSITSGTLSVAVKTLELNLFVRPAVLGRTAVSQTDFCAVIINYTILQGFSSRFDTARQILQLLKKASLRNQYPISRSSRARTENRSPSSSPSSPSTL